MENIPHTRDWIVWETGVAKNRDIWVFEPYSQLGSISVVIPYLKHYVIFDVNNDAWLGYMRKIIESYDDSHILPTVLLTGGLGALLAEKDKTEGAIWGTLAGLVLCDKTRNMPMGIGVNCVNCNSSYNLHIPQGVNIFRCPVCNQYLKINPNI